MQAASRSNGAKAKTNGAGEHRSEAPGPATARQSESAFTLIFRAVGGRKQILGKATRLGRTLRLYFDAGELERRFRELERRGHVEKRPTRLQIAFGALDMLRFVIVPFARDYYRERGIDFKFHQLLRFLDDPVSIIDPTGLLSDKDTIIGHLMQVVHLNPVYDLQLLEMFPEGVDELERQLEEMLRGAHPRAATIGAIVEDAGYHQRLLDYVRAWRTDRQTPELVRESSLRKDPSFSAAERTFATLPGFLTYAAGLPKTFFALLARYRSLARFPVLAEALA
jgi:hypothetical protein